ncbi:hypothetical protein [Skermania piniformis]|uniref:Uncharacterized protein n=1 Tax=Skermania pinensis TaxID=39122 RepID=A0ABX8S4R8_9ACTN|nr:hypothetical protein [Skermania piniformis]QXQ12833.1 hypothetical protein KV203_12965 [Skermania piniformis]
MRFSLGPKVRPRRSTVILLLLWILTFVLYLLVRPTPQPATTQLPDGAVVIPGLVAPQVPASETSSEETATPPESSSTTPASSSTTPASGTSTPTTATPTTATSSAATPATTAEATTPAEATSGAPPTESTVGEQVPAGPGGR